PRATQALRNRSGGSLLEGRPDGPAAIIGAPSEAHPARARGGPPPRPTRREPAEGPLEARPARGAAPPGFKKRRGSDTMVLRGRCCSPPVVWRDRRSRARRALEMITLTTNAAQKVKGILEQEKENIPQGGLRIYVQGGGCSGFSYGMVLDEAAEGDQIFEKEGVKVIVDPMSLRYLEGAEVDYKEDLMGGGFAIKNPNATSTCGCGHSFNTGGESAGHGHGGHQH